MPLIHMQIGAQIAALRKARGMTQEQLAAQLGVSAPAVSKWETDSSYPDITLLCPLARALGVNVDELLQFEEKPSDQEVVAHINEVMQTARQPRPGAVFAGPAQRRPGGTADRHAAPAPDAAGGRPAGRKIPPPLCPAPLHRGP